MRRINGSVICITCLNTIIAYIVERQTMFPTMIDGAHNSSIAIDMENLQNFLNNNTHKHWTPGGTIGKINAIPSNFRHNDAGYKDHGPVAVSIGPYHHGKPSLQAMERKKMALLAFSSENKL